MGFQWLVLLFTGAAVFFLSTLVVEVLRRAYEEYEERYLSKRITDLSEMFFFVGPGQLIVLTMALTAIAAVLALLVLGPVMSIVVLGLGILSPTVLVNFYRHRRIKLFEEQLVDALVGMSSAFRAGMTLYQAMEEISKTSSPPLSQEFALTVREIRLGKSSDEAFDNLAERVGSDDLNLVVISINTARSVGGNMAEMLDQLSGTIRERFRIEGRIEAFTAQGKLQGIIIGAMPVLVWLAFDALRPDLTRPMMEHWWGYATVTLVVVMELLGAFFIRRIISIKV
ncbi:type II secretion system F family protein [Myxococcota bacterium]|nr:type II secretion system F family protein [Myxococcota bacterium]